eukprot:403349681
MEADYPPEQSIDSHIEPPESLSQYSSDMTHEFSDIISPPEKSHEIENTDVNPHKMISQFNMNPSKNSHQNIISNNPPEIQPQNSLTKAPLNNAEDQELQLITQLQQLSKSQLIEEILLLRMMKESHSKNKLKLQEEIDRLNEIIHKQRKECEELKTLNFEIKNQSNQALQRNLSSNDDSGNNNNMMPRQSVVIDYGENYVVRNSYKVEHNNNSTKLDVQNLDQIIANLSRQEKLALSKDQIMSARLSAIFKKQLQKEFTKFQMQTLYLKQRKLERIQQQDQKPQSDIQQQQQQTLNINANQNEISTMNRSDQQPKKKSRKLNLEEVKVYDPTIAITSSALNSNQAIEKSQLLNESLQKIGNQIQTDQNPDSITQVQNFNSQTSQKQYRNIDVQTDSLKIDVGQVKIQESSQITQQHQSLINKQDEIKKIPPPPPSGMNSFIPPPPGQQQIQLNQQKNQEQKIVGFIQPPPLIINIPPPPGMQQMSSIPPPPSQLQNPTFLAPQGIPPPPGSFQQLSQIPPPPMGMLNKNIPPPPNTNQMNQPPLPPPGMNGFIPPPPGQTMNQGIPPPPGLMNNQSNFGPPTQSIGNNNIPPPPGDQHIPPPNGMGVPPPPGGFRPPPPPGMNGFGIPPPPNGMIPPAFGGLQPPSNIGNVQPPPGMGSMPPPPPPGMGGMPPPPQGFGGMPPPPPPGGMPPPPPRMGGMPPPPPGGMPPPPFGMNGMPPPPFGTGGMPPPPLGFGGIPQPGFRPPMPNMQQQQDPNEIKIEPPPSGFVPKRLHWRVMTKFKLNKSIFTKAFDPKKFKADIDYDLLKDAFCKREEDLKQEEEEKKKMKSKTSKVIYVLDQKRVSDIGIQLSGYPMSIKDTVAALLSLDDQILDQDKIQKLQRISPNPDETEKLLAYKGDLSELTNIEQFLIQLLQVPSLSERLECMLFKNKFDFEFNENNKNLATLDSAMKGIRDNEKMKEIFTMILKIGNYLNYGTPKGKAQGFQMELLNQLSNIKSIGKMKMSLLEYLIHCIRKHDPTLLNFTNELVTCEVAAKIELSILSNKIADFQKGFDKIKKELQKTEDQINIFKDEIKQLESVEQSERNEQQILEIETLNKKISEFQKFYSIFTSFLKEAEARFLEVSEQVTTIQKDIGELIILFGEDDSMKSTDFFMMFFNFAKDFCNCYKNMLLSEKVKQEQEEKKQRQLMSADKNSQNGSVIRRIGGSGLKMPLSTRNSQAGAFPALKKSNTLNSRDNSVGANSSNEIEFNQKTNNPFKFALSRQNSTDDLKLSNQAKNVFNQDNLKKNLFAKPPGLPVSSLNKNESQTALRIKKDLPEVNNQRDKQQILRNKLPPTLGNRNAPQNSTPTRHIEVTLDDIRNHGSRNNSIIIESPTHENLTSTYSQPREHEKSNQNTKSISPPPKRQIQQQIQTSSIATSKRTDSQLRREEEKISGDLLNFGLSTDINIMEQQARMSVHASIVSAAINGDIFNKNGPVQKKSKKLVNYNQELGIEIKQQQPQSKHQIQQRMPMENKNQFMDQRSLQSMVSAQQNINNNKSTNDLRSLINQTLQSRGQPLGSGGHTSTNISSSVNQANFTSSIMNDNQQSSNILADKMMKVLIIAVISRAIQENVQQAGIYLVVVTRSAVALI